MDQASVFDEFADLLVAGVWRRLAVDGVDGVGKTTFAALLADLLRSRGVDVGVIHVDDFLNPVEVRHRRGRRSPEGYWRDSIDLPRLRQAILATDGRTIVEGVFLHRDELVDLWDQSFYLNAPFEVTVHRAARRDVIQQRSSGESERYIEGQRIYFRECRPWERATHLIDYTDLGNTARPEGDDR